jgi:hypothetical protein
MTRRLLSTAGKPFRESHPLACAIVLAILRLISQRLVVTRNWEGERRKKRLRMQVTPPLPGFGRDLLNPARRQGTDPVFSRHLNIIPSLQIFPVRSLTVTK